MLWSRATAVTSMYVTVTVSYSPRLLMLVGVGS